jgi:hypothetical protein
MISICFSLGYADFGIELFTETHLARQTPVFANVRRSPFVRWFHIYLHVPGRTFFISVLEMGYQMTEANLCSADYRPVIYRFVKVY